MTAVTTRTSSARNRPPEPVADVAVDALLDIVDDRAWLRADGYLPGPDDIPVAIGQVKQLGLRRGDKITGFAHITGQRKPATLQVEAVNGRKPGRRPDFYELTALYPQERLRLETEPRLLTTRVIDLVMPIGKGQRALIVAPPKAGKTTILQQIANAITENNPECHLMVV